MKTIRVIPRLDIKGPNLVKGIHLEGLRVMGRPQDFARYYYKSGADELMFVDVVASLYGRNSLLDIITKTASEIFIPLTVGGGLRSIEDINSVLRAGADKISLNTVAINNPEIIRQASLRFGSSTIVVAIEAIKESDGKYLAYTDNAREYTGVEVVSWAKRVEALGAGEIVITSVDKEGTGAGYDIDLVRQVSEAVNIPVIAHGGARDPGDVSKVILEGKADAICLSSILHYGYLDNHKSESASKEEGNTEFLKSGRAFKKIKPSSLSAVKKLMLKNGINCRY